MCPVCVVGKKWCLNSVGYGGLDILEIIKCVSFLVILEIFGYLVVKIFKINDKTRNIATIVILIICIIILWPFSNPITGCVSPCVRAYNCELEKEDKYICKFSDGEKEYEIKCSFENYN